MQVIQTKTRPARMAIGISPAASNRVVRRAFRLLGGRWGGSRDLLFMIDGQGRLGPFFEGCLRLGDPDFILAIDPNLESIDWNRVADKLRIQPFEMVRFRERMERHPPWAPFFVEKPDRGGGAVIDVDEQGLDWRQAARLGLPSSSTSARRRPRGDEDAERPVQRGMRGLTAEIDSRSWLIFGSRDRVDLAARYWCLRALGGRPGWFNQDKLKRKEPPPLGRRGGFLIAPGTSTEEVEAAALRWSKGKRQFEPAPDDPSAAIDARADYYFGSTIDAVRPYNRQLRTALPAPPVLDQPLRRGLKGVAEFRLLSPDPDDPDGVVLMRNARSRELVHRGCQAGHPRRVTVGGFAEARPIAEPALAILPQIGYEDAVAAPLEEAGYEVRRSDKGLYQQRSLALARGLRFLAWLLRQSESAALLALFHEYHLSGTPPTGYRRAVTYDDLRKRLHERLRESRKRLRQQLREQAELWLSWWVNELLERSLLVAGYVLPCPACALRAFYPAEAVGQSFTCRRCGEEAATKAPLVSSYQLNEAFFQLREHDGAVVTLLLTSLRRASQDSFLYFPEALLTKAGDTKEADAVVLSDGDLMLAEAKSTDALTAKEINWYRYATQRTRARRLIFATISRSQQLCKSLECGACAQFGAHHRDHAWNADTRAKIAEARQKLSTHSIEVKTLCYQSLVLEQSDGDRELSRFAQP